MQVKETPKIAFHPKSDVGIVVTAQCFQEMEVAAQRHEVKGILLQRPQLSCTAMIQNCVAAQKETHDHFATQIFLVHEGEKYEYEKCMDGFHIRGQHDNEDCCNAIQPCRNKVRTFTKEEVSRACDDILRNVPPEFSGILRRDAAIFAHATMSRVGALAHHTSRSCRTQLMHTLASRQICWTRNYYV